MKLAGLTDKDALRGVNLIDPSRALRMTGKNIESGEQGITNDEGAGRYHSKY